MHDFSDLIGLQQIYEHQHMIGSCGTNDHSFDMKLSSFCFKISFYAMAKYSSESEGISVNTDSV